MPLVIIDFRATHERHRAGDHWQVEVSLGHLSAVGRRDDRQKAMYAALRCISV